MGCRVDWQVHQGVSTQATLWHQVQRPPAAAPNARPRIPTLTNATSTIPHTACSKTCAGFGLAHFAHKARSSSESQSQHPHAHLCHPAHSVPQKRLCVRPCTLCVLSCLLSQASTEHGWAALSAVAMRWDTVNHPLHTRFRILERMAEQTCRAMAALRLRGGSMAGIRHMHSAPATSAAAQSSAHVNGKAARMTHLARNHSYDGQQGPAVPHGSTCPVFRQSTV